MKNLILTYMFCCLAQYLFAVPARPVPVNYSLPDGSEISVQLQGDEWVNWAVSLDEYTLLRNDDGFFEYAILDDFGDLKLSGIQAKNLSERSIEDREFLSRLPKNLRYSSAQIDLMHDLRKAGEKAIKNVENNTPQALSGLIRLPVILVGFADKPFSKTKSDFEEVMAVVNDYFLTASCGKLNLQVDVFGPYNLSRSVSYYDDECEGNPRLMARHAIDSAYQHGGANYANYDSDRNGFVDGVHIIFAGQGQEVGAPKCQAIWSHAWELADAYRLSGKYLLRYSCSFFAVLPSCDTTMFTMLSVKNCLSSVW